MLRFRLHQLELSDGRFFLPLPKLADIQLRLLSQRLEAQGFRVHSGSRTSRRIASKGPRRILLDGALGLASSTADLLDLLGPAIPEVIATAPRSDEVRDRERAASLYFSLKGALGSTRLQFFPRLESLRTWSYLRRDGLCGLTPDEAVVLQHLLANAPVTSRLKCVTAMPRRGSRRIQEGRNLYFESVISIPEFLESLRTVDSGSAGSASYLPRDSVLRLSGLRLDLKLDPGALGEWCSVE